MTTAVRKYLPESTATYKGHMKKNPKNVQSTQPSAPRITVRAPDGIKIPPNAKVRWVYNDDDLNPPKEANQANHIFFWEALADKIDVTL